MRARAARRRRRVAVGTRAVWADCAEHTHDPVDRRALLVDLSPTGFALINKLLVEHLANEERLLATLPPEEREQLEGSLRHLLVALEATA